MSRRDDRGNLHRTKPRGIIDWLYVEDRIRDAYRRLNAHCRDQAADGKSPELEALTGCLLEISNALGDELHRGYPLEDFES
jgi:hypothetical protein